MECRFPKRAISAADGSKTQKKAGNKAKSCSFQSDGKNSPKSGDFWSGHKKRKIQEPAWLLDFSMAETVGFEPTCPCGQLDFESSSLRPLRYVSLRCAALLKGGCGRLPHYSKSPPGRQGAAGGCPAAGQGHGACSGGAGRHHTPVCAEKRPRIRKLSQKTHCIFVYLRYNRDCISML